MGQELPGRMDRAKPLLFIKDVMKKGQNGVATLARKVAWAAALVLICGCAPFHKLSGNPWSQTAEKEEQAEHGSEFVPGDFIPPL